MAEELEFISPMQGVKIVDLTTFGYVPMSAAILADWGADVVKVEDTVFPDPCRGLVTNPDLLGDGSPVDTLTDHFNRGKRNIALDLRKPAGLEVFYAMIKSADVFVTSFTRPAQRKLKLTYDDLKPINPRLIFAHGQGNGPRGPDAEQPGFDGITYWTRGGLGYILSQPGQPFVNQRPAFGDVLGGLSIATGISAALYHRSVTGKGCVVDVSLLAMAAYHLAPDIAAATLFGRDHRGMPRSLVQGRVNPPHGLFETKDGRHVQLSMLRDHFWVNLLRGLGHEAMLADPRYATLEARQRNVDALEADLEGIFKGLTLEEVKQRLKGVDTAWAPLQSPYEFANDEQVLANEYVFPNPANPKFKLTAPPAQFNHHAAIPKSGAPRHGEHTNEVLRELGLEEAQIAQLKKDGVVASGSSPEDWNEWGALKHRTGAAVVA